MTRTVTVAPPLGQGDDVYGHIVSASPAPGGYLLSFDPALLLGGIAGNVALARSLHVACAPRACEPVPNDNFVFDETHQPVTYLLPSGVHGTVLTRPLRFPGTRVDAARLVQLVRQGASAQLYEPLESGVWLRTRGGIVRTFAQQYRP